MRLAFDGIEIEAATESEFEFLIGKLGLLRGVTSPSVAPSVPSARPLATEGRIRRTAEEIALGLSIEEAIERRRTLQGGAGVADEGVAFSGDVDLSEVPLD